MKTANNTLRAMGLAALAGAILVVVPSLAGADPPNDRKDRDDRSSRVEHRRDHRFKDKDSRRGTVKGIYDRDRHRDRAVVYRKDDHRRFDRKGGFVSIWSDTPGRGHVVREWVPPVYETRERRVWVEPVYEYRDRHITTHDRFGRPVSRVVSDKILIREGYFRIIEEQVVVAPGHYVDRYVVNDRPGFTLGFRW